ncbi:hypothetical protein [Streptomyces sp. 4N124]|uniref:hypothetical protein n=1 Tax=Streptomyces sp. 4N124 TaxID=3457420 RepID=UPI003FD2E682
MRVHRKTLLPVVGAAVLLAGACSSAGSQAQGSESDCVRVVDAEGRTGEDCLPLAPESARVDRVSPTFTDPTNVTNPLHPTGTLDQTIYGGQVDGKPFRTEVTPLPGTKTITWGDRTVNALISQYAAFSDGRIHEVALDWYAQADDGAVWYLGEDVFNYENGVVADTEGTWQAGKDKAPGAMIMPADPEKGDVYRPENLPGVVFEEVTVKAVDQTVDGPYGKVAGAITVRELHMDGSTEEKVFTPGYGEFSTGTPDGELEAVSLAVPTDAKGGSVPTKLAALDRVVAAAHENPTPAAVAEVRDAWEAYRASDVVPELLGRQMERDVDALAKAPADRAEPLRIAQNMTDLRLRYEPVRTVDLDRLALWARQLGIDAAAGDTGAVAGDVTSLELVRQRLEGDTTALTADVKEVRAAADRKDLAEVEQLVPQLTETIAELS